MYKTHDGCLHQPILAHTLATFMALCVRDINSNENNGRQEKSGVSGNSSASGRDGDGREEVYVQNFSWKCS